ncbi:MAG: hypothetical protein PHF00_09965 [Elusimicrobia bacterium]|nr:hypothetical protein [Elusimicrobiota bacterium]
MGLCGIPAVFVLASVCAAAAPRGVHLRLGPDDARPEKVAPYLGIADSVSVYGRVSEPFLDYCRRNEVQVFLAVDLSTADLRTYSWAQEAQGRLVSACRQTGCDGLDISFDHAQRHWREKFHGLSRSLAQYVRLRVSPPRRVMRHLPWERAREAEELLAGSPEGVLPDYVRVSGAVRGRDCALVPGALEFWRQQAAAPSQAVLEFDGRRTGPCLKAAEDLGARFISISDIGGIVERDRARLESWKRR